MPPTPSSRPLPTRILLLRHAETSAPDRFHGSESDVPLGDRGQLQAEAAARYLAGLRPDAIYSSGMLRARQTAAPIAEACGLSLITIEDLHERRMGVMSGLPRDQGWPLYESTKVRWMAGDLDASHEGAESFAELRDRVVPAFTRIAEAHRGQTIVVVAHGVVNRVLLCSLPDHHSHADFDHFGIEFVAVNDVRWDDGRWWTEGIIARPAGCLDEAEAPKLGGA